MTKRSLTNSPPNEGRTDDESVHKGDLVFEHESVLADEVVAWMAEVPAGVIVDCTAGGGGHSGALLAARDDISLVALDRDPDAFAAATRRVRAFGERAKVVRAAFSELAAVVNERQLGPLSGILADLGVSSHHFDTAERGFSFSNDGPLDMRMDPDSGQPLRDKLAMVNERDLADILYGYGDIRASRRAAAAVLTAWREGVDSTAELAVRLKATMPWHGKTHPATRVFQALRIWVNDEFGQLETLLADAPGLLTEKGLFAVISFHSGEDRLVKRRFQALSRGRDATYSVRSKKPIVPSDDETRRNPRSRSAKLRGLVRSPPEKRKRTRDDSSRRARRRREGKRKERA